MSRKRQPKPSPTRWRERDGWTEGPDGATFHDPALRIQVHRWIYDPGVWYLSVRELEISQVSLQTSGDLETAKRLALEEVRKRMEKMRDALNRATFEASPREDS